MARAACMLRQLLVIYNSQHGHRCYGCCCCCRRGSRHVYNRP